MNRVLVVIGFSAIFLLASCSNSIADTYIENIVERKEHKQSEYNKKNNVVEREERGNGYTPHPIPVKRYTDSERLEMVDMFYEWAVDYAEEHEVAVTDYIFNHGAAGFGDWIAKTPHGHVQMQDLDNPGYDAFDLHAIGGVVFYTSLTGDYGRDEYSEPIEIFTGFSAVAEEGTSIKKYLLVDNGIVYEIVTSDFAPAGSFGEYSDDGETTSYIEYDLGIFKVSKNKEAQKEWRRILSLYQ